MEQLKAGTAILLTAGDKARGGIWRWSLSALALIVGYIILEFAVRVIYIATFGASNPITPFDDLIGQERGDAILWTLYWYLAVVVALPVLAFSMRVLDLQITDLISPSTKPNWYLALITALSVFAINSVLTLTELWIFSEPGTVTFTPLLGAAQIYIPIFLVILALQAVTNELLFRGYLVQLIGRWTQSWWIISLATGSFYLLLYGNIQFVEYSNWPIYVHIIAAAAVFTLLALITGRLEYSIGAHVGINWGQLIFDFKPSSGPEIYGGVGAILYTGPLELTALDSIPIALSYFIIFVVCLLIHFRYFAPYKTSN